MKETPRPFYDNPKFVYIVFGTIWAALALYTEMKRVADEFVRAEVSTIRIGAGLAILMYGWYRLTVVERRKDKKIEEYEQKLRRNNLL